MKATNFEVNHPILIHQAIVAAAFATYLADPEDIVWRFIKQSPNSRLLEHAIFLVATIFIGAGAVLCTSALAFRGNSTAVTAKFSTLIFPSRDSGYFGEGLFAVGLASLAPLWGAVLLVAGEGLRLLRLARRDRNDFQGAPLNPISDQRLPPPPQWPRAFRLQAAKWGIFITMILFSIMLIDRQAETMAVASVIIWLLLNLPAWIRAKTTP